MKEDTGTEDNIQLGGEKENFCAEIPTFQNETCCYNMEICWSASYSPEAAADTASPAMTRFITNLQTGAAARSRAALKLCSRAGQREPWGARSQGCSSLFQK